MTKSPYRWIHSFQRYKHW